MRETVDSLPLVIRHGAPAFCLLPVPYCLFPLPGLALNAGPFAHVGGHDRLRAAPN